MTVWAAGKAYFAAAPGATGIVGYTMTDLRICQKCARIFQGKWELRGLGRWLVQRRLNRNRSKPINMAEYLAAAGGDDDE